MSRPIPFSREELRWRNDAARPLIRAAIALARSKRMERGSPEAIARAMWEDDATSHAVTRAVTQPATTTTSGWAEDLAVTALSDLLVAGLGPASASGAVFARSTQLRFVENTIMLPGIAPSANNVGFVAQNAVVPTLQLDLSAVSTLSRRKLVANFVVTSEMLRASYAEALVRAVITESINLAVDKILFDANYATSIRPAGVLAGLTATSAASAGVDAKATDLATLSGAVAAVSGEHIFVTDSATWARVAYGPALQRTVPIFASSAVSAKQLICIGVGAFVVINGEPRLELAPDGTLVMDTAAGQITDGSGTPSSNVRSLWQTDSVGLRLRVDINWGPRVNGAIAFINSVNW